MFIFLNTQKSGTASYKFFTDLTLKCDKNFVIIKENNKGILSLLILSNKLRKIFKFDSRFKIITDCGCFKTFLVIFLSGFFNKNIKIYTAFYHHVFTFQECLKYFQINEAWKLISLKLFSMIEKFKKFNNLNFLTVSQFSKENIVQKFFINENRVLILWNQLIENEIKKQNYIKEETINKEPYLLIISSLIKRKNLILIKKIANLYGNKIKFVCPTPTSKNNMKKINYLKKKDVKIYHEVDDLKLKSLYLNSSFILVPSSYEGLSLIPLESIMLSKPVIMSNINPHLFWQLPDKFYFDLNDFNKLLEKINFYLNQDKIFIDYSLFNSFNNVLSFVQRERKQSLYSLFDENF
tara:strand:+ start:3370 stop:4422 length:1053 start_codon:yes stop_codon:yes gene_type:complete